MATFKSPYPGVVVRHIYQTGMLLKKRLQRDDPLFEKYKAALADTLERGMLKSFQLKRTIAGEGQ